jgi:hypothetical protein
MGTIWRILKKLNIDLTIKHMIQQSHSWGYTQRNATQVTPEAPAHPFLLQPSYGNSQDAPLLMMNGFTICGIYT